MGLPDNGYRERVVMGCINGFIAGIQAQEQEMIQQSLQVICAWCGETMQEGKEPPSHGICERCLERVKETELKHGEG